MIKTQLEGVNGIWPNELPSVLWVYRTTARMPTSETPFHLAFGSEAIIQAEVGLTSYKVSHHEERRNEEGMRLQLDLLDEVRVMVEQQIAHYWDQMKKQHQGQTSTFSSRGPSPKEGDDSYQKPHAG